MSTEPAPAPLTALPESVDEVIQRMKRIDAELPATDGVACFNRMYLTVTELVAAKLTEGFFQDGAFIERMDVIFAGLYFRNVDAAAAGRPVNPAWEPLIADRGKGDRLWPIQFAMAGMNAHINHDLALAVVLTCQERRTSPDAAPVHADYQKVDQLLAQVEVQVREEFEPERLRLATADAQALEHLLSDCTIDGARDAAWLSAQSLWVERELPFAFDLSCDALARTVGVAGHLLLTPVAPPSAR
ncbi:DUF5995 family protein [Kitasatospora viridis]|uniref:Uncharacterized protein n=1 Tax=Kitasatospora viridis TaxID=281105 RepID=A0A561T7B6_9ACTN|nr:DUF5995 family protein [Kitasatospora viridis]TWF83006.1 hypothetical protein FHX73_14489 [Kitasatospora viridis]